MLELSLTPNQFFTGRFSETETLVVGSLLFGKFDADKDLELM